MFDLTHNCEAEGCGDPLEHFREIYLSKTSFENYTPVNPGSNWVSSKRSHNALISEIEICHKSIVQPQKLISPFKNDGPNISMDEESSDMFSHSNLNTAIHESDGFSDSDDDNFIHAIPGDKTQSTALPKETLIAQSCTTRPDYSKIPKHSAQNKSPQPSNIRKRQAKPQTPLRDFLKKHKKKSTSPTNKLDTDTPDSWGSECYRRKPGNIASSNKPTLSTSKIATQSIDITSDGDKSTINCDNKSESSCSESLSNNSGNLFESRSTDDNDDDFSDDNDDSFIEIASKNQANEKPSTNVCIDLTDESPERPAKSENTKDKKENTKKQARLSQFFTKKNP